MPDYPREVPKWDIYRCAACQGEVRNIEDGKGFFDGGSYILLHWGHEKYLYAARSCKTWEEFFKKIRDSYLEDCYYNWII